MKTQILKTALCLAALSAMALSAQAQVLVNAQIANPGPGDPYYLNGVAYGPTTSPDTYTGTVWNELAGGAPSQSGTDLLNSDGTASGINYAWGGLSSGSDFADRAYGNTTFQLLQSGVIAPHLAAGTLTFSNLNAGDTYNIAIVAQGTGFASSQITLVGGGTQDTTPTINSAWTLGADYVEFDGVAPTSGSITFDLSSYSGGGNYAALNGFQIQDIATMPEPSTMALLGLGGLGLAFLAIRRRHSLI